MTESANLTSLTPNFITDSAGGVWGLVPTPNSGNQVCYNGALQGSTANVALLLYDNHIVYQETTAGAWSAYKSGSWVSTTDPRIVLTESAQGTTVTTLNTPAIIDSTLEAWTMVNVGSSRGVQVACNGVTDTVTGSVTMLLYYNHLLYQENSAGNFYYKSKSSDAWTGPVTDPRAVTTPTITSVTLSNASFTGGAPSGTVVGVVSVTMSSGTFTGSLSVTGTNASLFMMSGNNLETMGVVPGGSYSINIVATESGATGSPFTITETVTGSVVAAPSITGVTLSNSSFAGGAASGTVVGSIAVAMSSGTFTGSLALSGANAASFQIVGSNLETNGVVAAGSYAVNVVATQSGATGSPYTMSFSITATGSTGTWWTTPPPQAAAAGFNTLKFSDDFTTTTTIAPSNNPTSGYNWYWASWGGNLTAGTNYAVNTGWHAGDSNMTAQGVTSAGADASPNGGIVKLQGGASNATLLSCSGWSTTFPTVGVFQHAYFEAYIQYRPGDLNATVSALGWPGWWSWSAENLRGLGFGGSSFSGTYTEIDFWEYAVTANGTWGGSALHGSMSGGGYSYKSVTVDNNWHAIGCLWTPGKLQFYYDNVAMGSAITTSSALETEHQFVMIGSGLTVKAPMTIPIFVDWVRVWTA